MNKKPKTDHHASNDDFNANLNSLPEFTWAMDVSDVRSFNNHKTFVADAEQRDSVARHLDLESLSQLDLSATLKAKKNSHFIELSSTLKAKGNQICVVSGDALAFQHKVHQVQLFTTEKPAQSEAPNNHFAQHLEEKDLEAPEFLHDKRLDLLRVAIEALSLELDPFPRKNGVTFFLDADPNEDVLQSESAKSPELTKDAKKNPFASLAELKDKLEEVKKG